MMVIFASYIAIFVTVKAQVLTSLKTINILIGYNYIPTGACESTCYFKLMISCYKHSQFREVYLVQHLFTTSYIILDVGWSCMCMHILYKVYM